MIPSNLMAKINQVVPQGPHFRDQPYWVTVDDEGKYSCQTLDPAKLILQIARVRAQDCQGLEGSMDLQSFYRCPHLLQVLRLTVSGSNEGYTYPTRDYFAVMTDEMVFEVVARFGKLNGHFDNSQRVLATVAYDHWCNEFGQNPSAEEHRGLLASTPEELAALVAPSFQSR